jgi:hypothetical protein
MITGCSKCRSLENIRKTFPSAQIENLPGSKYEYIVKDSTNLYYVYDNGGDRWFTPIRIIPLFGSAPLKKVQ